MNLWSIFDWDDKKSKLIKLEKSSESPDFWSDNRSAQLVMKQIADLRDEIQHWERLTSTIQELIDLPSTGDESF
ncbi:MAG: PCRF domain-containing protein, partial [Chloroflexi bacterium]|nr:PCRF domain-containing protein [Chloroflexota bacterium]